MSEEYSLDGYQLEPCPFCCATFRTVELYGDHVECGACGAAGPKLLNWVMAVRAWNEMPRATGERLKKQRARWNQRTRAQRKAEQRAEREAKNSPEAIEAREAAKQARKDRQWAAERQAWLNRPVGETA